MSVIASVMRKALVGLTLASLAPVAAYHATASPLNPVLRAAKTPPAYPAAMTLANDDDDELFMELHAAQYNSIQPAAGSPPPNVCDVYVRASDETEFWHVGKSIVREGAECDGTDNDGKLDATALAVLLQKPLIIEHGRRMLPNRLGRAKQLEVWCAPPISGFTVTPITHEADTLSSDQDEVRSGSTTTTLELADVGFLPERFAAAQEEEGDDSSTFFRVRLRADGSFPLNCPWLVRVD